MPFEPAFEDKVANRGAEAKENRAAVAVGKHQQNHHAVQSRELLRQPLFTPSLSSWPPAVTRASKSTVRAMSDSSSLLSELSSHFSDSLVEAPAPASARPSELPLHSVLSQSFPPRRAPPGRELSQQPQQDDEVDSLLDSVSELSASIVDGN